MDGKAYCNTDGDFLVTPQLGIIDIQTEMGNLFLQPGEICVIQRGVRFRVALGPGVTEARGHIAEVWGSVWELPDLGPLGGYGLANPRDFLYPTAHIDEELHRPFAIVVKNCGKHYAIKQDHSPFDVVAWHGNCVPYKVCSVTVSTSNVANILTRTSSQQYDLTKFVAQNSATVDHTDPSVNTVLTAKSVDPHLPLADYLWFGPRWDVASNSFRLPYFHRNSASELLACIYGAGLGRSDDFLPGGCSYEGGHTPHGGFSDEYVTEVKLQENEPRRILERKFSQTVTFIWVFDTPSPCYFLITLLPLLITTTDQMTIMVESSRTFLFTEYARKICGVMQAQGTDPKAWDKLPVSVFLLIEVAPLLALLLASC